MTTQKRKRGMRMVFSSFLTNLFSSFFSRLQTILFFFYLIFFYHLSRVFAFHLMPKLRRGEETIPWAALVSFPRPVLRAIVESKGAARLCMPHSGAPGVGITVLTGPCLFSIIPFFPPTARLRVRYFTHSFFSLLYNLASSDTPFEPPLSTSAQ